MRRASLNVAIFSQYLSIRPDMSQALPKRPCCQVIPVESPWDCKSIPGLPGLYWHHEIPSAMPREVKFEASNTYKEARFLTEEGTF